MMRTLRHILVFGLAVGAFSEVCLHAQEAAAGLDLRATITAQAVASNELTQAPRLGSPVSVGSRAMLYPTWKINENWFVTGSFQLATRPYFSEQFTSSGYGLKGTVLQSTLNYSRVSDKGSLLMRTGQMPTAFGSFLLHYDDADTAFTAMPIGYGYYYSTVSIVGVAGAQVDVTRGKWDARAQFANSSPSNPRSLFAHDQYGNWTGGAGYTVRQGFRIGASAFRGPYLDRHYQYFFPGEAKPSSLPERGLGLDLNWAHRHTSVQAELQNFVMPYKAVPTFRETVGYVEMKRVLSPRWYIAARGGFSVANEGGETETFETTAGFRPNRFQLFKLGYVHEHYTDSDESSNNSLTFQFVTTLQHAFVRR